MSMNLTSERCNKRKEPSHIAYDNILGAGLMMQIFEDDMKRTWNEQMIKIQHALKLKECKEKKNRLIWLGVSHHVHLSCTTHPMDITIRIPA